MQPWLRLLIIILSLAGVIPITQASETEKSPVICTLMSSVTATGSQETLLLGVHFILQPGWKVYAPPLSGNQEESARHPVFNWSRSQNIENIHLHWPSSNPLPSEEEPLRGYTKSFILPFTVDLQKMNVPLSLTGTVSFIACKTLCVPVTQTLNLFLPQGTGQPTKNADKILEARFKQDIHDFSYERTPDSFWWILIIAFLGGLVLNVMPCVLPVLSLKLQSFMRTQEGISLRAKSLASLLGILVSFLGLAAGVIIIERSGEIFGWGFHFQSPPFLIFMLISVALFAKSLWQGGTFDLPVFIKNKLQTFLGHTAKRHQVLAENFLTGIFATLLATPCTAPFLGTALTYALSQGPLEIFLIFMVMGLGFSLPYFILTIIPSSGNWLPKPGAWMEKVARFFAFLLIATACWIAWLLSFLISPPLLFVLSGTLLVSLFIDILSKTSQSYEQNPRQKLLKYLQKFCWIVMGSLFILTFYRTPLKTTSPLEEGWQDFNETMIHSAVQNGQTVLVDVTANWCITCQANKKLVLNSPPIQKALARKKVIKMRADWTQKNPSINAYLKSFGRTGIPFNAVYSPEYPKGIVLPELLTKDSILKILNLESLNP